MNVATRYIENLFCWRYDPINSNLWSYWSNNLPGRTSGLHCIRSTPHSHIVFRRSFVSLLFVSSNFIGTTPVVNYTVLSQDVTIVAQSQQYTCCRLHCKISELMCLAEVRTMMQVDINNGNSEQHRPTTDAKNGLHTRPTHTEHTQSVHCECHDLVCAILFVVCCIWSKINRLICKRF